MQFIRTYKNIFVFALGIIIAFGGGQYLLTSLIEPNHDEDEYHTHADFAMFINGKHFDLTDKKYMSGSNQVLNKYVHLHDGSDELIHIHHEGITIGDFFTSIGFTLTATCLTTDAAQTFCTDNANILRLYVNGVTLDPAATYIPRDTDRVLIYYGAPNAPAIAEYLAGITDKACIYSGTCPERGLPPPESCGLTCEI